MTDETITATAGIGHNNPPTPLELLDQQMTAATSKLGPRAYDLAAAAERCVVTNEDGVADAGDLYKMIGAAKKAADEVHQDTKAPHLAACRAVDDFFRPMRDRLATAGVTVRDKITQFQNEERARLAAEQRRREEIERAARLKAEAEAAASNQPPPPPAPIPAPEPTIATTRTEMGTTISSTTKMVGTVTDYDAVWPAVSANVKVREAIDKAVAAMIRGGTRDIPGVDIKPVHTASI